MADYVGKARQLKGRAQEIELVHFSQEQPAGEDSTCVVCRLDVPRKRLVDEVRGATNLHPGYTIFAVKSEEYVRSRPSVSGDNVNYESACDYCLIS